ncbi:hypothetical protein DP939_09570 [Spongiactinospora rosea]|uniref:Cytochrome P450 n=1 Tax=Spongiactinospora rosea TaxID=2248750 RepID=A0A366M1L2_9ACTN|nr:hypothetical protein DP939_09570 [Spongiactinospora rosea]
MNLPPEQLPVPGERSVRTVRRLRDEVGPIAPIKLPGGVPAWLVTTHEAITGVLAGDDVLYSKDARNFTALHDGRIPADWPMRQVIEGEHLLIKDGADHRRLRGLVSRAFTPARVQALAPRVQALADELLGDLLAEGDGADLVRCYTGPLPIIVICELFGVPPEERAGIRAWTQVLVSHDAAPADAAKAGTALLAYLAEHVERRRHDPADDLTGGLLKVQDADGDRLSGNELRWILWSVIVAGHETTMHLIANAVVALCADRSQLARVRERGDWDAAVEETLRSRNSVVNTVPRYPLQDVRIAGVDVGAGEPVVIAFGAGGTDPARYGPQAERFDVTRDPRPTWPSAAEPTSASAPHWPDWRPASRCPRCSPASPTYVWPYRRRTSPTPRRSSPRVRAHCPCCCPENSPDTVWSSECISLGDKVIPTRSCSPMFPHLLMPQSVPARSDLLRLPRVRVNRGIWCRYRCRHSPGQRSRIQCSRIKNLTDSPSTSVADVTSAIRDCKVSSASSTGSAALNFSPFSAFRSISGRHTGSRFTALRQA